MESYRDTFQVETRGETHIIDITSRIKKIVKQSTLTSGIVNIALTGSTAGISTIEYEDGLIEDLKTAYEVIAPRHADYIHNQRWGDGNGYAHIRATITGQSTTIPFHDKSLQLGTWQQIILIDFDNRPRVREVIVHMVGE
ncbi:MAG: YjbQ family protein [Spirochaetota bacterium]|nr:MAG: YjbQ family protein [Spirochaetota bacterium]